MIRGDMAASLLALQFTKMKCLAPLDIIFSNGQRSLPAHALAAPSRGISSGASTAHELQITMILMRPHHEQRLNLEQSLSSTLLLTGALRLQTLNTASLNGLLNGFACSGGAPPATWNHTCTTQKGGY
jgi:hypothetical protein